MNLIEEKFYKNLNTRIKPILEKFGEQEWGRHRAIVSLKVPSENEPDGGWVVRELASNRHYRVEIRDFPQDERTVYLISTGGESVRSNGLQESDLREALDKAIDFGPNHLNPPWR